MSRVPEFEFEFVQKHPEDSLGRLVESIWFARGTVPYRKEQISPTGATVAVIVLGDPIAHFAHASAEESVTTERGFLVGPHCAPTTNQPLGETYAVGIVTRPIGCLQIFGVEPSKIRGRVLELEPQWPTAKSLREQLLVCDSAREAIGKVQVQLQEQSLHVSQGQERCERALALLDEDPKRPVHDIAQDLGISHSYLDRLFVRWAGLTPRVLSRLLRLRALIESLDIETETNWSQLAVEQGWFDQAHLIRDFRRHTGVTPRQYVVAQRQFFAGERKYSAPGFVPEALAKGKSVDSES